MLHGARRLGCYHRALTTDNNLPLSSHLFPVMEPYTINRRAVGLDTYSDFRSPSGQGDPTSTNEKDISRPSETAINQSIDLFYSVDDRTHARYEDREGGSGRDHYAACSEPPHRRWLSRILDSILANQPSPLLDTFSAGLPWCNSYTRESNYVSFEAPQSPSKRLLRSPRSG